MMRLQYMVLLIFSAFFLGGCAVGTSINSVGQSISAVGQSIKNNVQGSHYLQTKNYSQGELTFHEAVEQDPENPKVNYYLGRFLLAEKKPKQALPYLQNAASLDPKDTDYLFWQGVALGELGKSRQERESYQKVLKIKKKHLQALIYLGHNQLKGKQYESALATYRKTLEIWPSSPSSLYNRALIAKILKRAPEEKVGWQAYLSAYPSGALAIKAADHLNRLGDFSYRNQYLGARTVTLTKIWFEPFGSKLAPGSLPSLDVVGATASNMGKGKLQIVAYQKYNKKLARDRAISIKKYLQNEFPELKRKGIGTSWFAQSETLKIQGKKLTNSESVRFFLNGQEQHTQYGKKKNRQIAAKK